MFLLLLVLGFKNAEQRLFSVWLYIPVIYINNLRGGRTYGPTVENYAYCKTSIGLLDNHCMMKYMVYIYYRIVQ